MGTHWHLNTLEMRAGVSSGEARVGWGVGGGGVWAHLQNASEVWVVATKRGLGGVREVGVVRVRGGVGMHWRL